MFTRTDISSVAEFRNRRAEEINLTLARFPLIVEILGELGKAGVPCPGDEEIRHGCERALTAMLAELARIEPAPPGRSSKAEESAFNWPQSAAAARLINPDQLQRIQEFIERVLGPRGRHP